jgi:hypothetical protein
VQIGDLVRYKYREQDIGIIIDTGQGVNDRAPKHKVMWLDFRNGFDWMLPTGLEVISEA